MARSSMVLFVLFVVTVTQAYRAELNQNSNLNLARFRRQPKPPKPTTPHPANPQQNTVTLPTPTPIPVPSDPVYGSAQVPMAPPSLPPAPCYSFPLPPEHSTWKPGGTQTVDGTIYPSGSYLQFKCNSGYISDGGYNALLCEDGRWKGTLGSCVPDYRTMTVITSYVNTDHQILFGYQVTSRYGQPLGTVGFSSPQYGNLGFGAISLDGTGSFQCNLPYGNYTIKANYSGSSVGYLQSTGFANVMVAAGCLNPPNLPSQAVWITVPQTLTPHSVYLQIGCNLSYPFPLRLTGSDIQCWQGNWLGSLACVVDDTGILSPFLAPEQ